jgi:membrane protease YdiL (CAAX protease family)
MSKIPFSDKHPIISSIIATFLFLMVITMGGVISGITGVSTNITLIITFSILAIVLAIYTNSTNNWNHYGFNSVKKMDKSNKWLFMPLFIIALLPLIVGFSNDLKSEDIVYIVVFMAIVSFAEETMFRGVILRMLQKKSNIYAIWGSCLLFSIPHLLNTLSGKAPVDAIVQTLFALIIGLILAMLMIKTNNIIPLIMYHFTNNTVSSITRSDVNVSFEWYFTLFMLAISVVYALYLYQQIKNKRPKAETDGLSQLKI